MNAKDHPALPRRKALVLGLGAALSLGAAGLGGPEAAQASLRTDGPLIAASGARLAQVKERMQNWREQRQLRSGGATLAVSNCNDAGPGSLRDAIAGASAGDTIDLSALTCSTISLSTGEIEIPQASLEILGPGRDALTIDAGGTGRAFKATAKYDSGDPERAIVLDGLTIVNGHTTDSAGCIYAAGNLALFDARISNCHVVASGSGGAVGGAITALANVYLANSIVSGNGAEAEANAAGGAIMTFKYAYAVHSTIESNLARSTVSGTAAGGAVFSGGLVSVYSSIRDNQASANSGPARGGAIYLPGVDYAGGAEVLNTYLFGSTVSGNQVSSGDDSAYGGGIDAGHIEGSDSFLAVVRANYSTISGNKASSGCNTCTIAGGAINALGAIQLQNSTVSSNTAEALPGKPALAAGGGLASWPTTPAPIPTDFVIMTIQSTISGNSASATGGSGVGGGAASANGAIASGLSTIAFNSASTSAGGLHLDSTLPTTATMLGSIVAKNQAPADADLGSFGGSTSVDGDHNLVMQADSAIDLPSDTLTLDPKLLPLADNGGPTLTHALADDSPAIDTGPDPGLISSYDQRGCPFFRVYGPATDIGAFEWQLPEIIFQNGFDDSMDCPSWGSP